MAMLTSSCFFDDRVDWESKDWPDHCVYRTSGITLMPTSSINLKPSPPTFPKRFRFAGDVGDRLDPDDPSVLVTVVVVWTNPAFRNSAPPSTYNCVKMP